MTMLTVAEARRAVKSANGAKQFLAGCMSAPIRIIRCSPTPLWLALVRTVKGRGRDGGRFLVAQQYWSAQQLFAHVLAAFESDLDDAQDAKDQSLFAHFALMGNFYPDLGHGDRVEDGDVGEVRTLLVDGDHLSRRCGRLLRGVEAWAFQTSQSTPDALRLRVMLPLSEALSPSQGAAAYAGLNALSGGAAEVSQIGYPPIRFAGGPDTRPRYRQARLLAWPDLEPLVPVAGAVKRDLKLLATTRPRLITSPAVRRLYGFLAQPGAFERVVRSLLKVARGNLCHCPFPGHRNHDKHASATVIRLVGQLPFLKCWMGHGFGHGRVFFNLGEVELRRPWLEMPERRLNPATQLLGWARLLIRSGVVDVRQWTLYPDFHELRAAVTEQCDRTPRGWRCNGVTIGSGRLESLLRFVVEFTACKAMIGHSTTTVLAPSLIALWMGIDLKEATLLKDFLKGTKMIRREGWIDHGRGSSYGRGRDTDEQHAEAISGLDLPRLWSFSYLIDITVKPS